MSAVRSLNVALVYPKRRGIANYAIRALRRSCSLVRDYPPRSGYDSSVRLEPANRAKVEKTISNATRMPTT